MIFLDTNVILSLLTEPTSDETRRMKQIARELFQSVEAGREEVTTSEVVIHEVCYILASRKHYMQPPDRIAAYLFDILLLPGFKLNEAERAVYLRALERFAEHPKLGFADAVVATRAERQGIPLATFDEYLASMPFVTRWVSESAPGLAG